MQRILLFLFFFGLYPGIGIFPEEHFLSFIIPCYNCSPWIELAVESIYQQSNLPCPFEIICTDDGSTDETYAILCALAAKHLEIKIRKHEKNQGGSLARNTCVEASQGDIIFCLDSDNILEPDSIRKLIDAMDEAKADVATFGTVQYFTDQFEKIGKIDYKAPSCQYLLVDVLAHADTPPWSGNYLYTRKSFDIAGGYNQNWSSIDTFGFGFEQLVRGCKMIYVPNTFYWHRHGLESYYVRNSRTGQLTRDFLDCLLNHRSLFTKKSLKFIRKQYDKLKKDQPYKDCIAMLNGKYLVLKEHKK